MQTSNAKTKEKERSKACKRMTFATKTNEKCFLQNKIKLTMLLAATGAYIFFLVKCVLISIQSLFILKTTLKINFIELPQKLKKIFCFSDKDPGLIRLWALTEILKKVKKVKPGLDPKSIRIKTRSSFRGLSHYSGQDCESLL